MTCIAGLVHNGRVWMGGDSASVAGWDLTIRTDSKVFIKGPCLIGFTTSWRMGQLLRYRFTPPEHPPGMDDHEYMSTLWIDAVRETLKAGGFARKDNEVEHGGVFLVGYRGRLFKVDSDYQVGEAFLGFDAVGCGDQAARGALYATRNIGLSPYDRLEMALDAAEQLSAGVRRPFIIYHL